MSPTGSSRQKYALLQRCQPFHSAVRYAGFPRVPLDRAWSSPPQKRVELGRLCLLRHITVFLLAERLELTYQGCLGRRINIEKHRVSIDSLCGVKMPQCHKARVVEIAPNVPRPVDVGGYGRRGRRGRRSPKSSPDPSRTSTGPEHNIDNTTTPCSIPLCFASTSWK